MILNLKEQDIGFLENSIKIDSNCLLVKLTKINIFWNIVRIET